eukprot:5041002-Prymnesium_polylepis.1
MDAKGPALHLPIPCVRSPLVVGYTLASNDSLYESYLSLRSMPLASFLRGDGQHQPALPVTFVNEDTLLRLLGLSREMRDQVGGWLCQDIDQRQHRSRSYRQPCSGTAVFSSTQQHYT